MEKTAKEKHISVLLEELTQSIEIFNNKKNTIIDCTLGMWWHAEVMLSKMNPWDVFVGFDADERNIVQAEERLKNIWKEVEKIFILSNFVSLREELEKRNIHSFTWIYYDLWLSSLHLDEADRWFSFRFDAPLDMRFDANNGITAAFVLNNFRREQLTQILQDYGEEPMTKKIVSAICDYRKKKKFETTFELNNLILENSSIPKSNTRVFQALRIEVNKELDTLRDSLEGALQMLESGGHIFVISFHSLEDRIVKQIFKRETRGCICTDLLCSCWHTKSLKILTKKPITPKPEEIQRNQRSRSAKARCAKKL
jgi:16S rRNA (cytosine1402-N4)-methyltransferase